ncbi:MAG: hypothetical protein WD768_13565 [Phycisphaeraceae bacterium]
MPKHTDRVLLEEVDWPAVLPWLKIFRCFRMAMHPGKLVLAMILLTSMFLTGKVMDFIAGDAAPAGEIDQYRQLRYGLQTPGEFEKWKESRRRTSDDALAVLLRGIPNFKADIGQVLAKSDPFSEAKAEIHAHYLSQYKDVIYLRDVVGGDDNWESQLQTIRDVRRAKLLAVDALRPHGTFHTALQFKLDALNRLARATVTFNIGWSELASRQGRHDNAVSAPAPVPAPGMEDELPGIVVGGADYSAYQDQTTVIAALRDLVFILPGWLWSQHRTFLIVYMLVALLLYSILGGAISRMCALDATRSEQISIRECLRFSSARAWSFFIAPIAPIGVVLVVGLLMMIGGFILFSPPAMGVDILGGLLFIVTILCGAIITLTVVLSTAAMPLAYPAMAVEGADVFDAIARVFNYVINRPWRWFIYNFFALLYGAVTYLFIAFLLVLLVNVVHEFVGFWVVTKTDLGVNRFDVIFPSPRGTGLSYTSDYQMLDWSGRIAAIFVRCWMFFTILLTMAYVVTFFFSAQTWIYLLLRKSSDGVGFEDVYLEEPIEQPEQSTGASVPDKMEPEEAQEQNQERSEGSAASPDATKPEGDEST